MSRTDAQASRHVSRVLSAVEDNRSDPVLDGGDAVITSWRRCISDYGLSPDVRPHELVVEAADVRRRKERLGELFDIAHAEMENLYHQTAGSGYAVLLTDAQGTVIDRIGDRARDREFASAGLWTGADWSETAAGTNGIGTCIAERRAITVHRDEHFLSDHIGLSCSAAPIFDPTGQLLAILDTSSANSRDTRASQLHTVALVNMSARLIENLNFLRHHRDNWILRFHVRPEFVGLLNEGIIAIDGDGRILAANPSAASQLARNTRSELIGHALNEVLDLSPGDLHIRSTRQSQAVWPVRDLRHGQRYFAMLRAPVQPKHGPGGGGAPSAVTDGRSGRLSLRALAAGGDPRTAYNVRCAERVADRNVAILLQGETGTGKEAMAQAIHGASARADKPFVAVNCASIPETLIESELFGYRPGAFTGARREGMRGKILQSSGGTLFLDEIGDMPHELQTRLLRVLEEREVLPLGSETPIPVDLHIISATHCNLPARVAAGRFREDLYYRLNGLTLHLPPLRDRRDKDTLIHSALFAESDSGTEPAIDDAAFDQLMRYDWPGNIRQLRNCLRTALALCDDGVIRLTDLPPEVVGLGPAGRLTALSPEPDPALSAALPGIESQAPAPPPGSSEQTVLLRELSRHRWHVTHTAAALGISRNTLYRKMRRHGITRHPSAAGPKRR